MSLETSTRSNPLTRLTECTFSSSLATSAPLYVSMPSIRHIPVNVTVPVETFTFSRQEEASCRTSRKDVAADAGPSLSVRVPLTTDSILDPHFCPESKLPPPPGRSVNFLGWQIIFESNIAPPPTRSGYCRRNHIHCNSMEVFEDFCQELLCRFILHILHSIFTSLFIIILFLK